MGSGVGPLEFQNWWLFNTHLNILFVFIPCLYTLVVIPPFLWATEKKEHCNTLKKCKEKNWGKLNNSNLGWIALFAPENT